MILKKNFLMKKMKVGFKDDITPEDNIHHGIIIYP
jgi:hypothetical protein